MPRKKTHKRLANFGPYFKKKTKVSKKGGPREESQSETGSQLTSETGQLEGSASQQPSFFGSEGTRSMPALEQGRHDRSQSTSATEEDDPVWTLYGESLSPENTPQSGDPLWQVFCTTIPGQDGMYRVQGERNSKAYGSYADVMKSEAWFEGTVFVKVAVKKLRHPNIQDPLRPKATSISAKYKRRLRKEVRIWMALSHPNIAPLLGYIDDEEFCMISPWFERGGIDEYLRHTRLGRREKLQLVAAGVTYLHSLSPVVVHGDLKPNNIVVDNNGVPHIIDFGLSKAIEEEAGTWLQSSSSHQGAGNVRWTATELVLKPGTKRSPSSDVYSFACVAFFIMTGDTPFGIECPTEPLLVIARFQGAQPIKSDVNYRAIEATPGLRELLLRCWADDPDERPSMPMVVDALDKL